MVTYRYFESFSKGMKAKLDPKYRRRLELEKPPEFIDFRRVTSEQDQETALPFTTKTKAYGTYVSRK